MKTARYASALPAQLAPIALDRAAAAAYLSMSREQFARLVDVQPVDYAAPGARVADLRWFTDDLDACAKRLKDAGSRPKTKAERLGEIRDRENQRSKAGHGQG